MEASKEAAKVKKGHPVIVGVLLVVGALLTFVAVFSIWINRQALNTDYWAGTSGKLLANEDIQQRVAWRMSDNLVANVDVQRKIEGVLPPRPTSLAGPATSALQPAVWSVTERI